MTSPAYYRAGVEAADDLLEHVFRVRLDKAINPLLDRDFLVMARRLADELHAAAKYAETAAIDDAIGKIRATQARGQGRAVASIEDTEAAVKVIAEVGAKIGPAVSAVLAKAAEDVITATKRGVIKQYKYSIDAAFTVKDERVAKRIVSSQEFFVRDSYGRRAEQASKLARDVIARGADQGLGPRELGKELQTALGSLADRSEAYYRMAAGVFVNKARSYAALSGYADAGIETFKFEAVMDEVTSLVCRYMHGRTFKVQHALNHFDTVAELDDPEDVKTASPWLAEGVSDEGTPVLYYKDASGDRVHVATVTSDASGKRDDRGSFNSHLDDDELSAAGIMTPPIHGNCRSTVVPVE